MVKESVWERFIHMDGYPKLIRKFSMTKHIPSGVICCVHIYTAIVQKSAIEEVSR